MTEYPIIADVAVDLEAIRRIAHCCQPERCADRPSCCATFEVCVDTDEVAKLAGGLPDAARWANRLIADGDYENPFDPTDDGLYAIDTDEDGLCVFAYRKTGRTLCSLHTWALEVGVRPIDAKPRSCCLWPLALSEDTPSILSVMDGAFDFPCNRRRSGTRKSLHPGVAEIIETALGQAALAEIARLLKGV